jgi:putative peptidoglycan lipid II flippase
MDNSQISLLIASVIGSALASGSITIFNLANNLQAVPLGVFAISYSIAAFPQLSEYFAKKDEKQFITGFNYTTVQILFFIIPISILMLLLRAHIVRLAFGAGKFDWNDTILTFNTLGVFTLSLFSQSLIPLVSRAFYARQNTLKPVIINLFFMVLNAGLAYYFGKIYGVVGMTAGFSAANILNFFILIFFLRWDLQRTESTKKTLSEADPFLFSSIAKILLASLLMGVSAYGTLYIIAPILNLKNLPSTHTGFGLLVQAGCATLVACAVYLISTYFFDLEESKKLTAYIKKIF